jgi:hypothetical protein
VTQYNVTPLFILVDTFTILLKDILDQGQQRQIAG